MAAHPVVAAALAAHGLTPEEALDAPEWRRTGWIGLGPGIGPGSPGGTGPTVSVSASGASVHRDLDDRRMPRVTFSISSNVDGRWTMHVTIFAFRPPRTIASMLVGRPVTDLVDLPGAGGLLVVDMEKVGRALRMEVAAG
jgi:hypothetical protein